MSPPMGDDIRQVREALDGKDGQVALDRILARLAVLDKALDAARDAGDALAHVADAARRNAYSEQSVEDLETELDTYRAAEDE
jgi:hypothetical protein